MAAATALSLAACSSSDDTSATTTPTSTATTSAAAPNSETALRATLADFYKTVPQGGQWDKAHTFLSPRCQQQIDPDEMTDSMKDAYGPGSGRNFAGDPEYLITMNGDVAKVVSKSYDGKGSMEPQTWTFINGRWTLDYC
nr:hypothetical protein [Gordonia sp. (in: high G+C Gram-positive bacteria)]